MTNDLAIVYSNHSQECDRAIALLRSLEHKYIEYLINVDFTQEQFVKEFGAEAEYPQVAIGTRHVGGLKDTLHHFELAGLL